MSDARLLVPPLEDEPWPTLGPEVCDWIEAFLVHGPGDVLGDPVRLTDELRLFIYRAYEVYPKGHELEGRRRFQRAVLSRRKGVGKTELAAWLAIAEMDPGAPVRCDGFRREDGDWVPVGRSVRDPYIPMLAVTELQAEDLAYGAAFEIITRSELADDYDVGYERIMHRTAPGKIAALAGAPGARDGARTTFEHFDESHLFISVRLKQAHRTMLRNLSKRLAADPWSLETTTMYAPGEESVAEEAHRYALAVARGQVADSRLFFDHRQAAESRPLRTEKQRRAAVREASGDAWPYTNIESIASEWDDPATKENDWRRFWLNQPRKTEEQWLPLTSWDPLARKRGVRKGARIVLAFDGSYNRDSTVLVAATVAPRPHVFLVRAWERPPNRPDWRTPRLEVMSAIESAFERFQVVEFAPDPPAWHREIEELEDTYGDAVVRFETKQPSRMGPACDEFFQAVLDERLTHDGNEVIRRHLGNCVEAHRRGYTVVTKSAPDSPDKIDAAVGAIIAYHRAAWHAGVKRKEPLVAWGS